MEREREREGESEARVLVGLLVKGFMEGSGEPVPTSRWERVRLWVFWSFRLGLVAEVKGASKCKPKWSQQNPFLSTNR